MFLNKKISSDTTNPSSGMVVGSTTSPTTVTGGLQKLGGILYRRIVTFGLVKSGIAFVVVLAILFGSLQWLPVFHQSSKTPDTAAETDSGNPNPTNPTSNSGSTAKP